MGRLGDYSPIVGADNLLSGVDEAGLGMVGRVQNLAGVLVGRRHDNETKVLLGAFRRLR